MGIDISEREFKKLATRQQNTILYENLKEVKRMIRSYRFSQKILYGWISGITAIGAWFINKILSKG